MSYRAMQPSTSRAVLGHQMALVNNTTQLPATILVTSDLKITIRDEDVTSVTQGDVVVNFLGGDGTLFHGTSATSILKKAGIELFEEFLHRKHNEIRCGDICVTRSYGLHCRAVFHALCIPFHQLHSQENSLMQFAQHMFFELLQMADAWGAKRIVFPIFELDGGLLQYHPDFVPEELCRAAKRVSRNCHSLTEIKILIFKNSALFQVFVKCLQFHSAAPLVGSEPPGTCPPILITPSLRVFMQFCPQHVPETDVYVAFTEVSGPQTETPEYIFSETNYDTAQTATAGYQDMKEIRQGNILMTYNNGLPSALVLQLGYSSQYSADQFNHKLEILEQMLLHSLEVADNLRASTFALPLDASCLKGFPCRTVFDLVLTIVRKRGAHIKHLKTLILIIGKDKISYLMMTRLCDIERKSEEGAWSLVGITDPDYQLVGERFLAELKKSVSWIKVYRNKNLSLLERYSEELEEVINSGDADEVVERMLWHGSSEEYVEKICKEGFNPSLQVPNTFGEGIHFVKHSNTALRYCLPDPDNIGYMILARVVTDKQCWSLTNPLSSGNGTMMDNTNDPKMFVCTENHTMFPAYIVVFPL